MKQPERVLIYENEAVFQAIKGDLNHFQPKLKALKEAYDALEIGDFTNDIFAEIKESGINKILTDFEIDLNKQLDQSGIKNVNLRSVALNGTDLVKQNLTSAFEALQSVTIDIPAYGIQRNKSLELQEIAFMNDAFVIANPEQIKELHCRIYLQDEADRYIHSVLVDLKNSLNDFSVMAKQYGFGFALSDSGLQHFFKINEDGQIYIDPYSIKNSKMKLPSIKAYNDRQQAMADRRNELAKKEREQNEREQAEIASVMYTKSQD